MRRVDASSSEGFPAWSTVCSPRRLLAVELAGSKAYKFADVVITVRPADNRSGYGVDHVPVHQKPRNLVNVRTVPWPLTSNNTFADASTTISLPGSARTALGLLVRAREIPCVVLVE